MQYHVPFSRGHPCASNAFRCSDGVNPPPSPSLTVASPPTGSVQATSSPAQPQEKGSAVGITVGQGLLSGRRIAVRAVPSLASSATPVAPNPAAPGGGMRGAASHWRTGERPCGLTHSSVCPPFSRNLASESPASMMNTTNGTVSVSHTYGEGIIRISDLRRQGLPFVESGLRLATLRDGHPVVTASSTHGIDTTSGASREGVTFGVERPPKTSPSRRHTRRCGLPTRRAPTFASASSLARASRGRNSTISSGGGQRRGRGSNGSGDSRSSPTVSLRSDGQLCDYRWFTARGRRCFVYDGRTYKGSSAHRMWEKVKEVSRQRGLLPPHQAEAAPRTSAAPRAGGRAVSGITHSTAAARTAAPRSHQASARARSAADRILTESPTRRPISRSPLLRAEPAGTEVLVPAQLPEEWRTLVEELGLLPDEEAGGMTTGTEGNLLERSDGMQPPASTSSTMLHHSQPRRRHLSTSSAATKEVIEVTDSGSSSEDTDDSEQRNGDTVMTGAPLQWPATSYFSDASSGWSSTSSFAASPACSSSPKSSISPKRKRVKQELCKDQAVTAAAGAPARLRSYQGVQVVEQGGWVYPVEVFASQQQKPECGGGQVKETKAGTSSSAPLLAANGRRTSDTGTSPAVLCGVDDLPLADLYKNAMTTHSKVVLATQPSRPALLSAPLSSTKASSGLSVVSGSGAAVPARPATFFSGTQASLPSTAVALRNNLVRGGVSAFLGADDNLDDFSAADLADMFVTGEEIGGLRYDG